VPGSAKNVFYQEKIDVGKIVKKNNGDGMHPSFLLFCLGE